MSNPPRVECGVETPALPVKDSPRWFTPFLARVSSFGGRCERFETLHDLLTEFAGPFPAQTGNTEHRAFPFEPLHDALAAGLPLLRRQQVQLVEDEPSLTLPQ